MKEKELLDISQIIPDIPVESRINFEGGINEETRNRYRKLQLKLAYYRGEKVKLEGFKKIITAKKHFEAKEKNIKSQAEQKVYAESHDDVLEIVLALSKVEVFISLIWSEIDLFNKDIEVWRTKQASLRSEKSSY